MMYLSRIFGMHDRHRRDHFLATKLLRDRDAREVSHGELFSIVNMDDRELREAIVQDILTVTMWEKEHDIEIPFPLGELCWYVPEELTDRIIYQLKSPEITPFLNTKGEQYKIKDDPKILQAAMDYCGVWYDGFVMPGDGATTSDIQKENNNVNE